MIDSTNDQKKKNADTMLRDVNLCKDLELVNTAIAEQENSIMARDRLVEIITIEVRSIILIPFFQCVSLLDGHRQFSICYKDSFTSA